MNEAVANDLYETINRNAVKIIKLTEQNKKLKGKVNKAYNLITSQKTCKEWNEGFDILRDIIKDGE